MTDDPSSIEKNGSQYRFQILPEARPKITEEELPSLLKEAIRIGETMPHGPMHLSVLELESRDIRIVVSTRKGMVFIMSSDEARRAGIPDSNAEYRQQIEAN